MLLDTRVRRTKDWPRGHFVWLCFSCYKIYGLYEDRTLFENHFGRYYEVTGGRPLKAEELDKLTRMLVEEAPKEDQAQIILLGEIAMQFAVANENAERNSSLLSSILRSLQPPTVSISLPGDSPFTNIEHDETV